MLQKHWRSGSPEQCEHSHDRDEGRHQVMDEEIKGDRILYRACPLCNASDMVDYFVGDCSKHVLYQPSLDPRMCWKQCVQCRHIFTEGYFTADACSRIFARTNENQKLGHDFENQRMVSSRMIDKMLPFASAGRWLDVGFGNGSLLLTAKEYGFTPLGTDLRAANVKDISSLGVEAFCTELDQLTLADKCSVISMADVLEHTPYPKVYLSAAHRLLAEGGMLLVSMPNTESIVWHVYHEQGLNPYWGEIEHYHNFSRSRLYGLLQAMGFDPVRYGVSERYQACMEVITRRR
jgi:2-polyprenyl-3-methyl-5-hydroxy-6-metoxy-1,4-benzoquinol methylase